MKYWEETLWGVMPKMSPMDAVPMDMRNGCSAKFVRVIIRLIMLSVFMTLIGTHLLPVEMRLKPI